MVDSIGNGDLNAFSKAYLLASKDLKTQPIDGKGWNDEGRKGGIQNIPLVSDNSASRDDMI